MVHVASYVVAVQRPGGGQRVAVRLEAAVGDVLDEGGGGAGPWRLRVRGRATVTSCGGAIGVRCGLPAATVVLGTSTSMPSLTIAVRPTAGARDRTVNVRSTLPPAGTVRPLQTTSPFRAGAPRSRPRRSSSGPAPGHSP